MDEKSTLGKKCNSEIKQLEDQDLEPSTHTLDLIRMFARVYSSSQIELQVNSIN